MKPRNLVYSVAMSLDGYIAAPDNNLDWITPDPEVDFNEIFARYGTVLMGRVTYEDAIARGPGATMPGMQTFVVSNTLAPEACEGVALIRSEGLAEQVKKLKRGKGKDIWLFGGGALFRSLLDLGLVDRIELAVIPVLLGGGTPMLPHSATQPKLRLLDHRVFNTTGTVQLRYAVET